MLVEFLNVFYALSPLGLIVGVSAILARRGLFSEAASAALSTGVIYLFLPCLIFDKITHGLDPVAMPLWWGIPLTAVAVFILGAGLSALVFRKRWRKEPDLLALGFLHNAGYIIIAIGQLLVTDNEPLFSAYCFLYVLGHSPLLWSVGKWLISGDQSVPFKWNQLITPPLCANVLAITFSLTGARDWIPTPVDQAIGMLGSVTVPAALVVLGASLSLIKFSWSLDRPTAWRAAMLKLVIIPAIVITLIQLSGIRENLPLLAFMLVLQACAPQATNLIVQVRTYGGNLRRTGTVLLTCYAACLFTIPFWIVLWRNLGAG